MKKNDTPWTNASDIGSANFCPKALEFRAKGIRPSRHTQKKQRAGDVYHREETKAAYRQTRQDQRCFVASYCLGPQHPVTQSLRDYRDSVLVNKRLGKLFVWVYYGLSPVLIRLFGHSRLFYKLSRSAVLWLAGRVTKG